MEAAGKKPALVAMPFVSRPHVFRVTMRLMMAITIRKWCSRCKVDIKYCTHTRFGSRRYLVTHGTPPGSLESKTIGERRAGVKSNLVELLFVKMDLLTSGPLSPFLF